MTLLIFIFTYPFSVYYSTNIYPFYFKTTNQNYLFLNIEGRLLFFVCSLCPIYQPSVHVECHHFVISHSFSLPLVALCSLSVPDDSSMYLFIFINFFPLKCPKYWCFSFLHSFLLTHMVIPTTLSLLCCCNLPQCVALCFLSVAPSFWSFAFNFFTLFCPKDSCFFYIKPFH